MREIIDRRLGELDAKRWLRRALLVAAVGGATGGAQAFDAGTPKVETSDAAVNDGSAEDQFYNEDWGVNPEYGVGVPMYGVDVPGCGG